MCEAMSIPPDRDPPPNCISQPKINAIIEINSLNLIRRISSHVP